MNVCILMDLLRTPCYLKLKQKVPRVGFLPPSIGIFEYTGGAPTCQKAIMAHYTTNKACFALACWRDFSFILEILVEFSFSVEDSGAVIESVRIP